PLHAGIALLLVEVQDRLGIAAGLVPMPLRLEPGTKRGVVVDLPVVSDPHLAVLVRHRLLPARNVHDGQAPMPEPDGPVDPQPFTVRAAVPEHIPHSLETGLLGCLPGVDLHDPDDSTHTWLHPRLAQCETGHLLLRWLLLGQTAQEQTSERNVSRVGQHPNNPWD